MSRKPYPSELADKVLVRLPDGMKVKLLESAHANNRSLSAEVVARLETSFGTDEFTRLARENGVLDPAYEDAIRSFAKTMFDEFGRQIERRLREKD